MHRRMADSAEDVFRPLIINDASTSLLMLFAHSACLQHDRVIGAKAQFQVPGHVYVGSASHRNELPSS